MLDIYRGSINASPSADFVQTFRAGTLNLNVRFRWDLVNEEVYSSMVLSLKMLRDADPLIQGTTIIRDYDYISWYASLPSMQEEIVELLDNGMEYPQSLRKLSNELKADRLLVNKEAAKEIDRMLEPYAQNRCWHLTVYDDEGNMVTGDLRPNSWIGNQRADWRFRVISDLTNVGQDDLVLCTAEVAVGE